MQILAMLTHSEWFQLGTAISRLLFGLYAFRCDRKLKQHICMSPNHRAQFEINSTHVLKFTHVHFRRVIRCPGRLGPAIGTVGLGTVSVAWNERAVHLAAGYIICCLSLNVVCPIPTLCTAISRCLCAFPCVRVSTLKQQILTYIYRAIIWGLCLHIYEPKSRKPLAKLKCINTAPNIFESNLK